MKKEMTLPEDFTVSLPFVRERQEEYRAKRFKPYFERSDLTNEEKVCIGNYQDVHYWNEQKEDWSCKVPETMKEKPWCYMINSCCRFQMFYDERTYFEKELINFNVNNIDSAIEKSEIHGELFVYRGVYDIDWLKKIIRQDEFEDEAFGSFSLKKSIAYQYTNPQNPIIFRLKLKKQMKALYIDETECEMLRPRKTRYKIIEIKKQYEESLNMEVTVITIEEILK
ncbi:hypothetical protein MmiHf6_07760 [Methanimicrococcus hongohii]|uniref:ADP ribosyltransferase domain-containing protein n=1 Tax=Methanimicrococcus hongohii TaxID=3028295 RepID=A0AA96UZB3_9EURY|nr:ADP-ribosyltransferase [Methanimicrococcus sp. Hf6]WNY23469.1 hypothetical protein MmiHf6_07760 [Methanimicrococcus sp. Hf6]